jgi:outer membrane lipoprotein SlyB
MIKKILISSLTAMLLLNGCATNEGPEYDGDSYKQVKRYEIGMVVENKPVVIKDDGSGSFFGIVIGAVLGSMIGSGRGSVLASLGGGIGGYYAGKEVGKANGAELTVKLDNGENVIVVVKGKGYPKGERIKIIRSGGKVEQVRSLKE